jgi:hypothetical protein
MSTDVLEKVKQLPPDKQQEVEDFINYLIDKYKINGNDMQSLAEKRRSLAGRLKGQIWMADDFNETPEDFKDYV